MSGHLVQEVLVQHNGLPSAMLGRAAVVRNNAIAAKANMNLFTVSLLCERIRTVIKCTRWRSFTHLLAIRCVFVNRKIR